MATSSKAPSDDMLTALEHAVTTQPAIDNGLIQEDIEDNQFCPNQFYGESARCLADIKKVPATDEICKECWSRKVKGTTRPPKKGAKK